ncbi:hypothetical protein [Piscirickettsia litoralis]|uniref:Uncharacterized protein n=1 Tax=Piscirickettsia litoralis TaxID=1891921 RepID=A0ABX3A2G0_9GAMM|nr:hypothetical protein [Piscirickettsia litoralis]ODN43052.1 hypothetical protein BGC07_09150 [Piscirickettsia litoralis]
MNTATKLQHTSHAQSTNTEHKHSHPHFDPKKHIYYSISCKKMLKPEGLIIENGFILSNN